MNDIVKSTLTVDKVFFRKERDQFYGDWTVAFWRELFQNSVDAGAKQIDIDLNLIDKRGSFGNVAPEDAPDQVTNVVFTDDGHGMTAEVLGDVYFQMGKSTKDQEGSASIGGFGRARIMTCFSQERYTILTKDRFVMGDGVHFEHGSITQQLRELEKYARAMDTRFHDGKVSWDGIQSDIHMLKEAQKNSGFAGCRVEVDLDASTPMHYSSKPGTLENMKNALKTYLSESQLPCDVTINKKSPEDFYEVTDGKLQARRGPVKRNLSITTDNGEVQFATVHTSEGKRAGHKGKMLVRVSGASMFKRDIHGLDAQVIIEIDPAQSRSALNSNRDGLKGEYDDVVHKLLSELTVETLSALKDKNQKVQEIKGELGRIRTSAPDIKETFKTPITVEYTDDMTKASFTFPKITSTEALGSVNLNTDILKTFLNQTYWGESFLNQFARDVHDRRYRYEDVNELDIAIEKLENDLSDGNRSPEWFLENVDEKAKAWVLACLARRMDEVRKAEQEKQDERLRGLHDIYVSVESANEKTRAAIRRHNPETWDTGTGKGKAMRSLLSVWTAACSISMQALYKIRPGYEPVTWTTGFVYSLPEEVFQGDTYRKASTSAKCVQMPESSNDYRLLINPVNDDGTLRYSPSKMQDLQRILVIAFHEVAHVLEMSHNETFANVLTEITSEVDWKEAFRKMKAEYAAVVAAYANGKVKVQSLDNEEGPRPAERLLALAMSNDQKLAHEIMSSHGQEGEEIDLDRERQRQHDAVEQYNITDEPRYCVGR